MTTKEDLASPRTTSGSRRTVAYVLGGLLVCLSEIVGSVEELDVASAAGRATGLLLTPAVVAALLAVRQKYRNRQSAARIYFWAALVLWLLRSVARGAASV